MIRPPVGRYLRYWYTYRTAMAVLIAVVLSGALYWLYTQQVSCDAHAGCMVNLSVHPEDRLVAQTNPDPNVVIVGIDDASIGRVESYPMPRDSYAKVLRNLVAAGAAVGSCANARPLDPDDKMIPAAQIRS